MAPGRYNFWAVARYSRWCCRNHWWTHKECQIWNIIVIFLPSSSPMRYVIVAVILKRAFVTNKIFIFTNATIFAFTTFITTTPLWGKVVSKVWKNIFQIFHLIFGCCRGLNMWFMTTFVTNDPLWGKKRF